MHLKKDYCWCPQKHINRGIVDPKNGRAVYIPYNDEDVNIFEEELVPTSSHSYRRIIDPATISIENTNLSAGTSAVPQLRT